jgi:Asp-tRNA(Asn)/Glu-tRNA(Gln) amidotransferase C subunit
MKIRHRLIPTKPTWSTDIFLQKSEKRFTEEYTARLAHRASLRIDSEQLTTFTRQINEFVAMVSPILNVPTHGVDPLVSITAKRNEWTLTEPVMESSDTEGNLKLQKLSQHSHQGYYHIL